MKIGKGIMSLQLFEATQLFDFTVHRLMSVNCDHDFAYSVAMVT